MASTPSVLPFQWSCPNIDKTQFARFHGDHRAVHKTIYQRGNSFRFPLELNWFFRQISLRLRVLSGPFPMLLQMHHSLTDIEYIGIDCTRTLNMCMWTGRHQDHEDEVDGDDDDDDDAVGEN